MGRPALCRRPGAHAPDRGRRCLERRQRRQRRRAQLHGAHARLPLVRARHHLDHHLRAPHDARHPRPRQLCLGAQLAVWRRLRAAGGLPLRRVRPRSGLHAQRPLWPLRCVSQFVLFRVRRGLCGGLWGGGHQTKNNHAALLFGSLPLSSGHCPACVPCVGPSERPPTSHSSSPTQTCSQPLLPPPQSASWASARRRSTPHARAAPAAPFRAAALGRSARRAATGRGAENSAPTAVSVPAFLCCKVCGAFPLPP